MSVYKKLIEVQTKLKAPKNQYNSFGKYNYRSAEDILEAVKPLLKDVGATMILNDDIMLVGERYYVKTTARFIDIDSGEVVEATGVAREEESKKGMDSSQLTGSTASYSLKRCLGNLYNIDDTKDSDTTNTHDKEKKTLEVISEAQAKRMYMLAKGKDPDVIKQILSNAGFNASRDITKDKYNAICEAIEAI
jgi:hypothetical protein